LGYRGVCREAAELVIKEPLGARLRRGEPVRWVEKYPYKMEKTMWEWAVCNYRTCVAGDTKSPAASAVWAPGTREPEWTEFRAPNVGSSETGKFGTVGGF
jgi:hypothetical protein